MDLDYFHAKQQQQTNKQTNKQTEAEQKKSDPIQCTSLLSRDPNKLLLIGVARTLKNTPNCSRSIVDFEPRCMEK